jgi:hypothetical protein
VVIIGKVLKRLIELKEEEIRCLQDSGSAVHERFLDKKWLTFLSHLSYVSDKLNETNCSLQCANAIVFVFFDKISAFIKIRYYEKPFVKLRSLKCLST